MRGQECWLGAEEEEQVTVLNRVLMGDLAERENLSKDLKEEKEVSSTQGKSIVDRRTSWIQGPT